MFCPDCGRELKDGAKFCPGCGKPLNIQENEIKNSVEGFDKKNINE